MVLSCFQDPDLIIRLGPISLLGIARNFVAEAERDEFELHLFSIPVFFVLESRMENNSC